MRNRTSRWLVALAALIAAPLFMGGADQDPAEAEQAHAADHKQATAAAQTAAICVLHPTKGNDVQGWVVFTPGDGYVEVTAKFENLTPGKHGFHIHEFGDLTSADGSSAGGHFNPTGGPHASPSDKHRHAGDLGNLEADPTGKAVYKMKNDLIELQGDDSILGRSVVVHAGEDDLSSQPSGNSGDRIAVGVIGVRKTTTAAKPASSVDEP